jgi:hypothetical protein
VIRVSVIVVNREGSRLLTSGDMNCCTIVLIRARTLSEGRKTTFTMQPHWTLDTTCQVDCAYRTLARIVRSVITGMSHLIVVHLWHFHILCSYYFSVTFNPICLHIVQWL